MDTASPVLDQKIFFFLNPNPPLALECYSLVSSYVTITGLLFCDLPDVPCWVHTCRRPYIS